MNGGLIPLAGSAALLHGIFAIVLAVAATLPGWNELRAAAFDAEIAAFEAADAANPPPPDVIPFVGSSSIKMWPNLQATFPRHPVLNRGFGGSQMSDVLFYFDRVVTRYQPPLVVVYEGDNDLAAGKSVAQVFADYSNFVWRVQQSLPATDIAFISVKPSPSRVHLMDEMSELNALIAGMSDGRRIRYIDVYNAMLDNTGQPRPELFGPDNLHMNAAGYALWNSIVGPALNAWASTAGGTFLLDFGSVVSTTENGADDQLNHWNNITEPIGSSPSGVLSNLLTVNNSQTSIHLEIVSRFNSANANGSTASTLFPADATRDSLYGNTEVFNNASNIFPSFRLTGLDTQSVYHLTFYASRIGVADNRDTVYTVTGSSSTTAVLNAANNVNESAAVHGVTPDGQGRITVSLAPGANNNSSSHFTYLGVLKVDAIPPQRPIAFVREPASQKVAAGRPAVFNAAISGSPPFFIQWFSNGLALPGATQLNFTIPSVTFAMSGSAFSVSISNLAYSVTSSNALLEVTEPVTPTEPPSQVLLFDFGGANTTVRGPAPDDPSNQWNNVTTSIGSVTGASMTNLISVDSNATAIGLAILSRFNGANENGATSSAVYPADATRDSLFGNTETFSGLSNITPAFKFTGLETGRLYSLTFYASRTGVSDNRETVYTVGGAATNSASLNAANNISNTATVSRVRPSANGEFRISLTPGAANNNPNHFTYLGVLRLERLPLPRFVLPAIDGTNVRLQWSEAGALEWSPEVSGPWTPVSGGTNGFHSEPILPGTNRFFRLRAQ